MENELKINDDIKILKLDILKKNLKQNWTLDTDIWNEEFPHDYRFEDTYLQLSFVLRDFNMNELKHLISITNLFDIKNYNHEISTLINNYIKSCVDYLNHEIDGKTEEYFKKFNKNDNCFSYEKRIKDELNKYNIQYSVFFYGTLRSLEVREAVLGKDISKKMMDSATLKKYKLFKVKDAHYPLIKYTNNKKDIVYGIIAKKLSYNQIITLDKFEGKNYFRQFIKVSTNNNILDAQIYLPKANLILSEPWNYDDWYKNDMKKFFENEFDLNGVK